MATRRQPKRGVKANYDEKPSTWEGGPPEIKSSEIRLDRLIGEGSFGKVYAGTCRGSRVAIKVPSKQLSAEEMQELRTEVAILSSIYHPNTVLFMGACTKDEGDAAQLMIVTELKDCTVEALLREERERRRLVAAAGGASGGRKGTYMATAPSPSRPGHSDPSLPPSSTPSTLPTFVSSPLARLKMARDTALGVNWLHNISHIIHRDLKTANLLYDRSSGRVCVTDFGLSQALAPQAKAKDRFGPRGSALFMAPEVVREQQFDQRIDTYSFGIILWELWTCEEPFGEFFDFDTFVDAVHRRGLRPPISSQLYGDPAAAAAGNNGIEDLTKTCPPKLVELIKACWADAPAKRPKDFEGVLHALDAILVDLSFPGHTTWPDAASFWFDAFCKDDLIEEVSWNEFVVALEAHVALPALKRAFLSSTNALLLPSTDLTPIGQLNFDILAPLLTTADGKTVTLTQFAEVVEWFGHWYHPQYALYTLNQIHEMMKQEWFTGAITRQEAEGHLNDRTSCPFPDAFLVRLSASFPGCPFTITRPAHSTRRPNLRVKRVPYDPVRPLHAFSDAAATQSPFLTPLGLSPPFLFVVDYGADGTSKAFFSLTDLVLGLRSELRLVNASPPSPTSHGY